MHAHGRFSAIFTLYALFGPPATNGRWPAQSPMDAALELSCGGPRFRRNY
jgi:hypothetical protein